jgi:hypothetical protein
LPKGGDRKSEEIKTSSEALIGKTADATAALAPNQA